MNVFRIVVMLFVVGIIAAHADETNLTLTVDGQTYSNVVFGTVSPSSVSIRHSDGIARIPLAKLPPDLQTKFGYDPENAANWQKYEAIVAETAQLRKQLEEIHKNSRIGIMGEVADVVEGKGVILTVKFASNNNKDVEEKRMWGIKPVDWFLVCDTSNLVNDSKVQCLAYPDGTYTYTTVMGAHRKIPRYVYYGPLW